MAICAHFTTYDQKRQKALLALQVVPNHSGEAQFSVLLPVLEDSTHWKRELSLAWSADQMRIRCIGHIINLIIQAFLFTGVVKIDELESYDEEEKNGQLSFDEAKKL